MYFKFTQLLKIVGHNIHKAKLKFILSYECHMLIVVESNILDPLAILVRMYWSSILDPMPHSTGWKVLSCWSCCLIPLKTLSCTWQNKE